ncbi:MAG: TraR/DksA C4-type zinc finger protein [Rhizobiaceae bacterium]|nr:TraR/DksA C4-type zinc finger protein [Rhizobiaceae bacterium]
MRATNAMIELAEERVEMERQLGIADVRAAARRQRTYLDGAEILVCTCGEIIPEARRRAVPGTRLCIDCATFAERRDRSFA